MQTKEEYFLKQVSEFHESTIIAPDKNGDTDNKEMNLIGYEIKKEEIEKFCNNYSISKNTLFLASTFLTLNKFNFSCENLIFIGNNVPIAAIFKDRSISIEEYLKEVDEIYTDCLEYDKYSFEDLLEIHELQTEFYYDYNSKSTPENYSNYLNIVEEDDSFKLSLSYNEHLYTTYYIELFLKSIGIIINQIITSEIDKLTISDIALIKEKENVIFSEIENPFLHKHFEKQVEKTPDRIALIATDETLTYNELNQKANRIANSIIKRGIESKNNILIVLPRTSNMIAAILGILKAGCAFIPMDPEYPKERIEYIYKNSEAKYIISNKDTDNSINIEELLKEKDDSNPHVDIQPDDLAYMIYTSGSTGKPKGVMIMHENISNLTSQGYNDNIYHTNYLNMQKAIALSTVAFDAFLIDFISLTFGLTVILANDDEIKNVKNLTELMKKESPDALTSITPSRLEHYLEYDEFRKEFSSIKHITIGGEKPSNELISDLLENYDVEIFNGYGPTETTVTCNYKQLTDSEKITIGKALHNYIMEVSDIDGKILPQGIMGELYIGGEGVGKGYYNLEEKTKESFIEINNIPYYKSGDYAVETSDGEIVIKGRMDNQIKLRGLRIEIGEIESNINNYPSIKHSIVLIKKVNNVEHLCAYFTAKEEIDENDLKEHLKDKLTPYMVPTLYVQLDEMPETPNGKIDVKQLPEPEFKLHYVPPANPLEQTLCSIFSMTLNLAIVGAEDNFFEIGGNSLLASKLIIDLIKHDYDVKYEDIFNNQTPRELAKFLCGESTEADILNKTLIENYDYTPINELLSENTLENFEKGEQEELGNILLTGVTGYLGIHVLYEFIKSETGTAYCILRKGKFDSCEERLIDLMNYYFDEDLSELIGSRIILSEGDITELDDFKKLEEYPIDTIINCAANVKHYAADDTIFRVNVDGVINGAKFAKSKDAKFIQTSTVSVLSPPTDESVELKFDEQTLYYQQDLSNKYANSKFLAEKILLEKAIEGLDIKIIRLGNLMARYDNGLFQPNYNTNAFLGTIKAFKLLHAISSTLYNEVMEMSPIDYVAKAIIALSKTPNECRLFNCLNENTIHTKDLINALNTFDFNIETVDDEEFIRIVNDNIGKNIEGLITSELSINELKNASEWREYGRYIKTEQTCEILHSLGIYWPEIDEEYLKRFISYLNQFDFFE